MLIAALFIIARTWKQPRCPSADEWIRKLWYIYTMEYYSAIKKNIFESVLMRWVKLEPIIQSKPERKTPIQYTNAYIWNLERGVAQIQTRLKRLSSSSSSNNNPICETAKETQIYRTVFWTLWERAKVGRFGRMALKHVYCHMWNESPVQVWCMTLGALGWPRGMGWGGTWEGDSGWGTRVHPWWIHVNVGQNQYNIVK